MALRYSDKPWGGHGPQGTEDWKNRFPAHSRPMDSAPVTSKPIRVYEPDGKSCWALHHLGVWRKVVTTRDSYGQTRTAMTSEFVNNPVRWSSS
jgi:hypothetical protein